MCFILDADRIGIKLGGSEIGNVYLSFFFGIVAFCTVDIVQYSSFLDHFSVGDLCFFCNVGWKIVEFYFGRCYTGSKPKRSDDKKNKRGYTFHTWSLILTSDLAAVQ